MLSWLEMFFLKSNIYSIYTKCSLLIVIFFLIFLHFAFDFSMVGFNSLYHVFEQVFVSLNYNRSYSHSYSDPLCNIMSVGILSEKGDNSSLLKGLLVCSLLQFLFPLPPDYFLIVYQLYWLYWWTSFLWA